MADLNNELSLSNSQALAPVQAAPVEPEAEYWVSRDGGPVTGPYTIEQLRHWVSGKLGDKLQYLGRIWITDLTKTNEMPEWISVDKVLAAAPGDNTTDYWVTRNGQMTGPYTLGIVADWVKSGRILYTDEIKNIAMPEWITVHKALDGKGFSVPPLPPARPAAHSSSRQPSQPPARPATSTSRQPPPALAALPSTQRTPQKGLFSRLADAIKGSD